VHQRRDRLLRAGRHDLDLHRYEPPDGTGFDDAASGSCDTNSVTGGATGWLVTSGNVTPGEVITLRIAIWDTSDHAFDSLAVIDGFQWSVDVAQPGTVIFNENPGLPKPPSNAIVDATRVR